MKDLFYYTGIAVWVIVALAVFCVSVYRLSVFERRHIRPTIVNLRFGLIGNRSLKGRYYQIWLAHHAGRRGVQKHFHSWGHLRRFAYRKFLREVWKERHLNDNN